MKYFGSILDFTRERNADLMRVYRDRLAEASIIVMPVIFQLVADSPASRFWVSEERAAIVIPLWRQETHAAHEEQQA